MKKHIFLLTVVLSSFTTTPNDKVDRIGVPGPLTFNETTFDLSWTDKPSDTYYVQEYLPKGENSENFTQMVTLHVFETDINLKDAVRQKMKELEIRKKTDPTCNYLVTESKDGKEYMVDFLLGESKNDKMTIIEFNIYHYQKIDLGDNKKGILTYAYSKRAYGDDITPFLKNLGNVRPKLLKEMITLEKPTIKLADK